jgi:hypothetical protein
MATREKILMRYEGGCCVPVDYYYSDLLKKRGFKVGDVFAIDPTKPRDVTKHRKIHRLCAMFAENIDAYHGMDSHEVLKTIQRTAKIECDFETVIIPEVGELIRVIPKSISFDSMTNEEFDNLYKCVCRHVGEKHMDGLAVEKVEEMVRLFVPE